MNLQTVIEHNKRWLQVYFVLARLTGVILITLGCVSLVFATGWLVLKGQLPGMHAVNDGTSPMMKFDAFFIEPFVTLILPGLLAMVAAGLIRYLRDENRPPAWLVRQGDKILYLAALAILTRFLTAILLSRTQWVSSIFGPGVIDTSVTILTIVVPNICQVLAKMLIAIGLGQALCRLLPIIEESKGLI